LKIISSKSKNQEEIYFTDSELQFVMKSDEYRIKRWMKADLDTKMKYWKAIDENFAVFESPSISDSIEQSEESSLKDLKMEEEKHHIDTDQPVFKGKNKSMD